MSRDVKADDPHPILRLRKAMQADAAIFPELEQSAGLSFRADREIAWLADADNLPAERYCEIIAGGWSWIAEGERAQPVAFVAATLEGEELHLWEFNVHIEYQLGYRARAAAAIDRRGNSRQNSGHDAHDLP